MNLSFEAVKGAVQSAIHSADKYKEISAWWKIWGLVAQPLAQPSVAPFLGATLELQRRRQFTARLRRF
jgi:hypothetical protein